MSDIRVRLLGPVEAEREGRLLPLTKPRWRELLAILAVARGRRVSTDGIVDALWEDDPPAGARGSLRTFIGELRRVLEPERPPRSKPQVLVTDGDGYRLDLSLEAIDVGRVDRLIAEADSATVEHAERDLSAALSEWRGPALDEFADRSWAAIERARLAERRSLVIERLADVRLGLGRPAEALPLLDAYVTEQPWREPGWRLLALALHRIGRSVDALAALDTARRRLREDLGLDPSTALDTLYTRILRRDPALDPTPGAGLRGTADALTRARTRTQLEASNAVLSSLALAGDIAVAREQRIAAIGAAEELGDPLLSARVIGGFDTPGIWTRSDDPAHAGLIVAAAQRALAASPVGGGDRLRARLLATIAMESRGTAERSGEAHEAEAIARRVGDPLLLCFALSARFLQTFDRTGLAVERRAIGEELVGTARAVDSPVFEVNGRLIRLQALCAQGHLDEAAGEADVIDAIAREHDRPLAGVFTGWFRWTFRGAGTRPAETGRMPGFEEGIAALDDATRAIRLGTPLPEEDAGPYEVWVRPLRLARLGDPHAARALRDAPEPPRGLLLEVLWCLLAEAAIELGDVDAARRCLTALTPASAERAAGSGVIDLGPVAAYLGRLGALAP